MALPRRNLTFRFPRSIVTATGKPETLVVAIVPLATPSAPGQGTYVGGVQETEVVLSQDFNETVFEILPSDHPTLTERVVYRVGWRSKFLGRETHYDIVMPDQDIYFDELEDLGAVLGGETYLHQADRSRPGGVAALNDDGQVTDALGNVVSGEGSAQTVQNNLNQEIIDRQNADAALSSSLGGQLTAQYTQVLQTTATNLALAASNLEHADSVEAGLRSTAVTNLNNSLQALQTATNNAIAVINNNASTLSATVALKADIVGGKLRVDQVPDIAIGKVVSVADQAAMLALTTTDVQPGDMALRPDGVWFLNATNPATLANWQRIERVSSVNGQTGVVVLNAASVGARSSSVVVPQADVDGLVAALAAKASTTLTTTLSNRISAIENDATLVHLNGDGQISSTLLDSGVVYVDNANQIRKKDGTILAVNGGGLITSVNGKTGVVVLNATDVGARPVGVPLVVADITGLSDALADKVADDDSRLTDARTPTPHASTHRAGGSDPLLPIELTDVNGLNPALAGKASSTTVVSQGNRISSLETRVTDLEAGGPGGGGGGSSAKTIWFDGVAVTGDFDDVSLKSPIGYNPSNPDSNSDGFYYDPAGAADGEWAWPYLTPNGHLKFRVRNESAPVDDDYAFQSDVDDLTSAVALRATITSVALKADQTALDATNAAVLLKASQTSVDALTTTVAGKASQADLTTLTTTVSGKASQTDLTSLTTIVSGHTTTLGTKADLSGGVLATGQIPTVPQNKVANLTTDLANKADLAGGTVPLAQIPTNIPITSVAGLAATFAGKADLDGNGKVLTSQMPAIALGDTYTVANRAAMLALTTTQVQRGDIVVITATADKGTYRLNATDPSVFSNWILLSNPDGTVASVNGQTGIVVLGASDVGARSSTTLVPLADVNGLPAALAAKANESDTATALATKATPADVRTILTASAMNKQVVSYVATSPVISLSGQQLVDGVLAPLGSTVLLSAQSSSIQNGIYTVASGAWSRASDMSTGSYLVRGSQVIATAGSTNTNTIWQETAASGVVDVAANNWSRVGYVAPQYAPVQGNGITITGTTFAVRPTTGISVTGAGVGIDTTLVPRKYAQDVPSGLTTLTITHNLGTLDVQVQVREKASGDQVDLAYTVTGVNAISMEFLVAPAAGQYRVVVIG